MTSEKTQYQYAPAGWKTITRISTDYSVSQVIVKKTICKFENRGTTLVKKMYKTPRGYTCEHFSPASVESIYNAMKGFLTTPKAPNGWLYIGEMEKTFNYTKSTINLAISQLDFLESKEYKNEQGRIRLYYSPESVKAIFEKISDISQSK